MLTLRQAATLDMLDRDFGGRAHIRAAYDTFDRRTLDSLVRRGLVERRQSPGRAPYFIITRDGHAELAEWDR